MKKAIDATPRIGYNCYIETQQRAKPMTTASITLYIGTAEYEFDAEGHTYAERYEGTWCDGPDMVTVEDVTLTWVHSGEPVKKQFLNFITAKQWDEITDAVADAHGEW